MAHSLGWFGFQDFGLVFRVDGLFFQGGLVFRTLDQFYGFMSCFFRVVWFLELWISFQG